MARAARSPQQATRQADAAANALLDWMRQQGIATADSGAELSAKPGPTAAGATTPPSAEAALAAVANGAAPPAQVAIPAASKPEVAQPGVAQPGVARDVASSAVPLRLPHTDWLHHRLAVTGPADGVAAFQAAARGPGTIPWQLDLDRVEEDLFLLLASPRPPQRRTLSLAGARVLAVQLRAAVALRHDAAVARVGRSQACALDLHALVPVPPGVLELGPDHPDALAWLGAHWGTTEALRHVAVAPPAALRTPQPAGSKAVRFSFWSADWTPWQALAQVAARWPGLRFDARPSYGKL